MQILLRLVAARFLKQSLTTKTTGLYSIERLLNCYSEEEAQARQSRIKRRIENKERRQLFSKQAKSSWLEQQESQGILKLICKTNVPSSSPSAIGSALLTDVEPDEETNLLDAALGSVGQVARVILLTFY